MANTINLRDEDGSIVPKSAADIGVAVVFVDTNGQPYFLPNDSDGYPVFAIGPVDPISRLPVIIDFEHHQVHEGESYKAINEQLSIATNTVKYAVEVGAYSPAVRAPHMIVKADVYNGSALVRIYESATYTGGAAMSAANRNRNSSTTAGITIKSGVTSTNGTQIDAFFVGVGNRAAGANRNESEWILKANTIYRVDVVGLAAGTQAVVSLLWYEDLGV